MKKYFCVGFVMFAIAVGIIIGKDRGIPFVSAKTRFTIGIYNGNLLFNIGQSKSVKNPALSPKDITDVRAGFVADPFLFHNENKWYVFFEVYNNESSQGDIGVAESDDAINWHYQRIVLDEDFHLSYPQVFSDNGQIYMMPESSEAYKVTLYKAVTFPFVWEPVEDILKGNFFDSTIFNYNGYWWIFTSDRNDILHLFYSNSLFGKWREHPQSPVIFRNAKYARPGGGVVKDRGHLYRFAQDDETEYGLRVFAFEITDLTPNTYHERLVSSNPVVGPSGHGWNAKGMHQFDAHKKQDGRWIAAVDGRNVNYVFGLKY